MQPTALDGAREKGAALAASRTAGEAEPTLALSLSPSGEITGHGGLSWP